MKANPNEKKLTYKEKDILLKQALKVTLFFKKKKRTDSGIAKTQYEEKLTIHKKSAMLGRQSC